MKMHHFSLFAAMVLTIAVTGPPAMAQTPDGSTPAVEGICDTLKADGISKGLYGLCVAYCEAQDFSSEDEPLTEADILALLEANAPSGRILENYNKRRTVDDPEMPCVVPKVDSCPCFTQAEMDHIDGYNDVTFELYPTNQFSGCRVVTSQNSELVGNVITAAQEGLPVGPRGSYGPDGIFAAVYRPLSAGGYICRYRKIGQPNQDRYIYTTAEETIACRELVRAAPVCAAQ